MIWIIIACTVVAVLFYHSFVKPLSYWKDRGVEGGHPWPIVGDSWKTVAKIQNLPEFVLHVYKFGPGLRYCGIFQGTVPTLIIKDPELIKQITVKDFDYFTDRRTVIDAKADPLAAKNLLGLKGQEWRDMRALLSPSFTSSKLKSMYVLMQDTAKSFAQRLKQENKAIIEVDLKDLFARYANDIIASTAFGVTVDSLGDPDNTFYAMGKRITNFNSFINSLKFIAFLVAPKILSMMKVSFLDRPATTFFCDVINETIKEREEKGIVRPDMINLLLEARNSIRNNSQNGKSSEGLPRKNNTLLDISNTDITAQALIFFFAGFDTTSSALGFLCMELAINPDIQKRLRDEIVEASQENNGNITYEILQKMKYLEMVISESQRKWPIGTVADRVCVKPYTIEPTTPNERPIHLNKGDITWIPIMGFHRDPAIYPDPEKFDPERFSDENKDKINPYLYMPFGLGPRSCIGNRFALLEIKAVLFEMLRNFEIVPTERTKIPLTISKKHLNLIANGGFHVGLKPLELES